MFREVRRRTNVIGCFENKFSLNKVIFLRFKLINQRIGDGYFVGRL